MRFANDSDSCCKCFLVDLGCFCFYRERLPRLGERMIWCQNPERAEHRSEDGRRNLAAVSLETRIFVNFGAYSEWWKIKCFLSVSDFRFTIRQNHRTSI